MSPERTKGGTRVRVLEHHRREALRGMAGKVVGRYGRGGHLVADVRLLDCRRVLFWPRDLEEVTSARPRRWRSLLEGAPTR